MQILSRSISALNVRVQKEIGVEEHDGDVRFLDRKWKYGPLVHAPCIRP